MAERLSAVGGGLSLGPVTPGRGFRLTATVPRRSGAPAAAVAGERSP